MNLLNSKTRFAVEPDTGRLYDYGHGQAIDAKGMLDEGDGGFWDLAHVKALIEAGLHIDAAHYQDPMKRNAGAPAEPIEPIIVTKGKVVNPSAAEAPPPDPAAEAPVDQGNWKKRKRWHSHDRNPADGTKASNDETIPPIDETKPEENADEPTHDGTAEGAP